VIPMPGTSTWEQERVNETIKRLKLNEHTPLAEARRKVWQQLDRLIGDFMVARTRSAGGHNPAALEKFREVRLRIREMINPAAELSAVARWCLLVRNDPQLSKLVG
jgi:hypothetical protein